MNTERILDIAVWLFIFGMGIVAAVVCFGMLKSDATGAFQSYSLGGAFVGALITWSTMATIYKQMRGNSNEVEDLRQRVEELQNKVIRGAPRPKDYVTEVDDKQRIVLARPRDWKPKGGMIFALEEAAERLKPTDNVAALFRCYVTPLVKAKDMTLDKYYDLQEKEWDEMRPDYVHEFQSERKHIGGESAKVKSLKIIAKQFARVEFVKKKETGRIEREWRIVSRDEFVGHINTVDPQQMPAGKPDKVLLIGFGFGAGAICYVNGQKREIKVTNPYNAVVTLVKEDVATPRALTIELEHPEAKGVRSNAVSIVVTEPVAGQQTPPEVNLAPEPEPTPDMASKPSGDATDGLVEKVVYQEISRMIVICYHEALEMIFVFEFVDSVESFQSSSETFNSILDSTRFLD